MRFQKLFKLPKLILVILALGGAGAYYLEVQERENHSFAGVPKLQEWHDWQNWHRIMRNSGFMVGYSELRMNPLWVTYRLEEMPAGAIDRRPSGFQEDWRSVVRVKHDDYTGSGYDRGHLAPNYAIAKVHGREAQLETFLMTNISPQKPNLNRKIWQRIEQTAMDYFAPLKKEVWVITGPIFAGSALDYSKPRLARKAKQGQGTEKTFIEIPTAFYKIFIAPATQDRPIEVLAFIVPQDVKGNEPLTKFVRSVREVEKQTGLDFMHRLPQPEQDKLEQTVLPELWQLEQVSRLKGRF